VEWLELALLIALAVLAWLGKEEEVYKILKYIRRGKRLRDKLKRELERLGREV